MGAEWVLWEAMPRQSQRCTGRNVCEGKQGESRERQSKSLDCGAGLTPVNGRGQAGGVGRKRLRPCSSETVSARLKRLQDCPWWSLIIATAMLSQDWGCPRRVRHTEGTVPAPRSLVSSPLTQWRQKSAEHPRMVLYASPGRVHITFARIPLPRSQCPEHPIAEEAGKCHLSVGPGRRINRGVMEHGF